MDNRFPIYDITIDGSEEFGLTAISFVDDPAIKKDFLYFSNEKPMIFMFDDEKREVVSPILIPNQLILRQDESGAYYYIRWTEEVIRECAYRYLSRGWFNNFTIMHPMFYNSELTYEDVLQDDVEMLRMWIVENADADDINVKYGFDLPEGTLCVHIKVNNEALWNRIKSHELKGLSIEAFTSMVKISQSKIEEKKMLDVDKNTMSLFQKFLAFMNDTKADAQAIADQAQKDTTNSGDVALQYWLDNEHYMQVDAEGFVRDEEMNLIAEGKYMLADGNYLIVNGDNKFVGTEAVSEEVMGETVQAPIAEQAIAQESVEENNAVEESKVEENAEQVEEEVSDVNAEDGGEDTEDDGKEDGEVGQDDAEKALSTVSIGEVSYDVPTPIAELIDSLIREKSEALSKLQEIKDVTPSAEEVKAPLNSDETSNLFSAIAALNRKR